MACEGLHFNNVPESPLAPLWERGDMASLFFKGSDQRENDWTEEDFLVVTLSIL
jgi:hypothetical protein